MTAKSEQRPSEHDEAVALVRSGKRARTASSLFGELGSEPGPDEAICKHPRGWRTIACNGDLDVVECPICGAQTVEACNFDEEYA